MFKNTFISCQSNFPPDFLPNPISHPPAGEGEGRANTPPRCDASQLHLFMLHHTWTKVLAALVGIHQLRCPRSASVIANDRGDAVPPDRPCTGGIWTHNLMMTGWVLFLCTTRESCTTAAFNWMLPVRVCNCYKKYGHPLQFTNSPTLVQKHNTVYNGPSNMNTDHLHKMTSKTDHR